MDEEAIKAGFADLDTLAKAEYHEDLREILSGADNKVAARLGRLVGVLIKEPMANEHPLTAPSQWTGAYREWHLKDQSEFDLVVARRPWQYLVLDRVRKDLASQDRFFDSLTTYTFAGYAQYETGFFRLYAKALRKYICGDKLIRKKVEEALEAYTKTGGASKALTPERVVAAGGLTLGTYLVQVVPLLGIAGAPVIAGIVVILYALGVDAFCKWADNPNTDDK